MTDILIVSAAIVARADSFARLLNASLDHAAYVRSLPGCIEYRVAVDAANRLRIVFFERWSDADSLALHFNSDEMHAYMQLARTLVASGEGITVYAAKPVEV